MVFSLQKGEGKRKYYPSASGEGRQRHLMEEGGGGEGGDHPTLGRKEGRPHLFYSNRGQRVHLKGDSLKARKKKKERGRKGERYLFSSF